MNREIEAFRVRIAGRWSAEEMALFLLDVRDLYNLRLTLELMREDFELLERDYEDFFPFFRPAHSRRRFIWRQMLGLGTMAVESLSLDRPEELAPLISPDEQLQLLRFRFASPGFGDLAGVGAVVGHLKDLLIKVIDLRTSKRQRELENEDRELKNEKQRLENARAFIDIARECGLSEAEIRRVVVGIDLRQRRLAALAHGGKIVRVEQAPPQSSASEDEPEG